MREGKRVDPTVTRRVKGWDMGLVRLLVVWVDICYVTTLCAMSCYSRRPLTVEEQGGWRGPKKAARRREEEE